MKSLLLITTLLFSTLMFSSPSCAKWEKVTDDVYGTTFYLDFGRIRKDDGYVYAWILVDYLKTYKDGYLSGEVYVQGDCKLFRIKSLSYVHHKEPMSGGTGDLQKPTGKNGNWTYPAPNSPGKTILKSVCSR